MFSDELRAQAEKLLAACRHKGLTIATAESCTGGLIAALLTEIPGASDSFERGFITYSNRSKTEMLGVDAALMAEHGAVSEQVAAAMAQGAMRRAQASIVATVTGIAGPGGGTAEKPVGLVHIAVAAHDSIIVETHHFHGNRTQVRLQTVAKTLEMLDDKLSRTFMYVA